jgi:hypothetical protein
MCLKHYFDPVMSVYFIVLGVSDFDDSKYYITELKLTLII